MVRKRTADLVSGLQSTAACEAECSGAGRSWRLRLSKWDWVRGQTECGSQWRESLTWPTLPMDKADRPPGPRPRIGWWNCDRSSRLTGAPSAASALAAAQLRAHAMPGCWATTARRSPERGPSSPPCVPPHPTCQAKRAVAVLLVRTLPGWPVR